MTKLIYHLNFFFFSMEKYRLKNGITLISEKNHSKSVAVEVMFKVGSNYESPDVAGISHFLEHMLFEGTKKRKDSREIANEIEKYGGEFNAYTTGERTAFFIKIINSRLETALDILSDMVANPVFNSKIIEKEKQVVLKEINMVNDEPKLYQWILFQKSIFSRHPARNPTYGSVRTVKGLLRKNIHDYYSAHYIPNNMIISIVGNLENPKDKIEKYFGGLKPGKRIERQKVKEPLQIKAAKFAEKRKTLNSYMVLGYKSVPRMNRDSYVFDVISAILGRGQSGWIFDEIRNKRGLAYQVGIQNESDSDYGSFAVYAGLDKSKITKASEIIILQFKRLQKISAKELKEAKTFIEGNYTLEMEDNFHRADSLAFWESIGNCGFADSYLKNVQSVKISDVVRVSGKYLNSLYTMVVVEQE